MPPCRCRCFRPLRYASPLTLYHRVAPAFARRNTSAARRSTPPTHRDVIACTGQQRCCCRAADIANVCPSDAAAAIWLRCVSAARQYAPSRQRFFDAFRSCRATRCYATARQRAIDKKRKAAPRCRERRHARPARCRLLYGKRRDDTHGAITSLDAASFFTHTGFSMLCVRAKASMIRYANACFIMQKDSVFIQDKMERSAVIPPSSSSSHAFPFFFFSLLTATQTDMRIMRRQRRAASVAMLIYDASMMMRYPVLMFEAQMQRCCCRYQRYEASARQRHCQHAMSVEFFVTSSTPTSYAAAAPDAAGARPRLINVLCAARDEQPRCCPSADVPEASSRRDAARCLQAPVAR